MASLKSIKFRHLAHQLTEMEYDQFLLKLRKIYGRDFISTLLFNAHKPSLSKQSISNDKTDGIIQIISDIMQFTIWSVCVWHSFWAGYVLNSVCVAFVLCAVCFKHRQGMCFKHNITLEITYHLNSSIIQLTLIQIENH